VPAGPVVSEEPAVPEFVRVDVDAETAVATIQLDRPPLNALDRAMQTQVGAAARELSERDDVRAVVLHGGPKAFAAGADIKEMVEWSPADVLAEGMALEAAFSAVARMPQPVIAAVTGYALGGGCELALCADLRVVGETATLGQPEILLGIMPGAGGSQRLPRLVGVARAKELIWSGRWVAADEALRIGLADRVVADDQVLSEAHRWAAEFAARPAIAVRAAKQAIDRGLDVDLDGGLELERLHFASLFGTEDRVIGMRSFLEHGPGKARFLHR
jgi:enoyl-CoA hydratase/carnithine racemase